MAQYEWADEDRTRIKTERVTTIEETFSLVDLAEEWRNIKAKEAAIAEQKEEFKKKVDTILTDLDLSKDQLIGLATLEE